MAKRELLRKIDQEIGGAGTGGGAYVAGANRHRMLSPTHTDSDAGDTPANGEIMVYWNLWQAMSASELIELVGGLFVGRKEGAHVGLFSYTQAEGKAIEGQATDTGGAPFVSFGSILDVPNSFWLRLGHAGGDQVTYENDGTRPGIEQPGVWSIPTSVVSGYFAASNVLITDADGYFATADVEGALEELATANPPVRVVTDTTTELAADRNGVIVCNKGTAMTVNLLAATGSGRHLSIKSIGAGAVTVDAASSETIDGETTQTVGQWDALAIVDYASGAWGII